MKILSRRVGHLEANLAEARGADHCRSCRLRHVRPLTIALVRSVLRVAGGSELEWPTILLCLCGSCCGEAGDRWFAGVSHGLLTDEDAA